MGTHELALHEMQQVTGAGGKLDPGTYGDALPVEAAATEATTEPGLNKASPKLFL